MRAAQLGHQTATKWFQQFVEADEQLSGHQATIAHPIGIVSTWLDHRPRWSGINRKVHNPSHSALPATRETTMDSATITGLRSLKLSETPVNSDQALPSTQASTSGDQAHLAGHQDHVANSLASDASDVPSSPVLPSTSPAIRRFSPKLDSFGFRVWTDPTHLKHEAMMR